MIQLQQSNMELLLKSSSTPIDINSNIFNEGYWGANGASLGIEMDSESPEVHSNVRAVSLRLEGALRAAKKAHLQTSEVLLPPDLLTRISRDILSLSETEPCGIRGCLILLHFETPPPSSSNLKPISTNNSGKGTANINNNLDSSTLLTKGKRNIGTVKCDPSTVTTFELHLSLREDLAPWYSRLPQIIRNFAKGGTIVVSPKYTVEKKKLYRSH